MTCSNTLYTPRCAYVLTPCESVSRRCVFSHPTHQSYVVYCSVSYIQFAHPTHLSRAEYTRLSDTLHTPAHRCMFLHPTHSSHVFHCIVLCAHSHTLHTCLAQSTPDFLTLYTHLRIHSHTLHTHLTSPTAWYHMHIRTPYTPISRRIQ